MTATYDAIQIYVSSHVTYDGGDDFTEGVGLPPLPGEARGEDLPEGEARRDTPKGETRRDEAR